MKNNGFHINEFGTKCWYKDGELHREDGPALIYSDGAQLWYKEGEEYEPSAHDLMTWKMNERRATH